MPTRLRLGQLTHIFRSAHVPDPEPQLHPGILGRRLAAFDPHPRRAARARQYLPGAQCPECAERAELRLRARSRRPHPAATGELRARPHPSAGGQAGRSGQAAVHRRRPARRPWAWHRRHEAGQRDRRCHGGRTSLLLHRLLPAAHAGTDHRGRVRGRSVLRRRGRSAPSRGRRQACHRRQLPGRLAGHDDGRDPARPRRPDPAGRLAALLLGGRARPQPDALSRRHAGRDLADRAHRRHGQRHLRRRPSRRQLRIAQSGQHLLGEGLQRLFQGRHRGRTLPRFRDLVGQPGPAQCRRDAVDRRQSLRRQQAHRGRDPHLRRHARRPAQHQVADHRAVLVGRQHHAAAAGAGLDHRPVRPRGRDRRQRPDHRLHAAPDDRPSRHLRLGQGCDQGTRRVRLLHGDDRPDAARPLRGGDRRGRQGHRASRPHPRQVSLPPGGAHPGRHPRARRQQRRGQPALRRGRPPVGDQSRPLPHARPAGGAGDDDGAIGRADAADASQPPALHHVLRQEPDDAAGEGAGRVRARGAQAGRA